MTKLFAKLFITGATGYIGGDALYAVANTYPDLEITALVRSSDKGAKVAAQYPQVRLVYGDLGSSALLTEEASKADIVLHCANCDHVGAAKAIIAGLAKQTKPTYMLHISGAANLCFEDWMEGTYGVKREKVYDDWDGIGEVTSLPDYAPHRNVEKLILAAGDNSGGRVRTAIVCPPCIYGPGRGPDNQMSVQVYEYVKATLKRRKGFIINKGTNYWTESHVQDISALFLALVTSAMSPDGGNATWNKEGYYFTESGEFTWGDVGRNIAKVAFDQKLINTADVDVVNNNQANQIWGGASFLWATNSRSKAIRANKLLGWTPKQKSVNDLLPQIIEDEAKAQGLIKGHAQLAAGQGKTGVPRHQEL